MKPQLAKHLSDELKKKKPDINNTYIQTVKKEGVYGYLDYINGVWSLVHGRSQKTFSSLDWVYLVLPPGITFDKLPSNNFRLIFEIYIEGVPFEVANGIINRNEWTEDMTDSLKLYCHDIVFFDHMDLKALERTILLIGVVNTLRTYSPIFKLIRHLGTTSNIEHAMELAADLIASGEEGLMLKNVDSTYQVGKRNQTLLKIKVEEEFTLKCIGIEYTEGEKGNPSTQLILEDEDRVRTKVRVGNLTEVDMIATEKLDPVGHDITINCMRKSHKGGYIHPTLPSDWISRIPVLEEVSNFIRSFY